MIHIALTIDENYVRYCTVVMASILENNKMDDITFHIVANDLTSNSKTIISDQVKNSKALVSFYTVPSLLLEAYELKWGHKRLSMTVFYRCLLATILPATIEKVIYMDCDVLVLQSLRDLWNTPMENIAVAGVQDLLETPKEYFSRLEYDSKYGYFNGGMLLINLDYWRKHNVENRLKEYFRANLDKVVRNDQDIMNAVLYKEKQMLDMKWNVQIDVFLTKHYSDINLRNKCLAVAGDIGILHYCYRKKPWHYNCIHPMRDLFFKYQKLTPFDDYSRLQKPLSKMHRFLHNLPYTLGIKESKILDKKKFERYLDEKNN